MPEIGGWTLVMAVQAIETEIRRLRGLTNEKAVPGDELLLVDYETAAEELEAAYEDAVRVQPNLPPYAQLVNRRE